MASFFALEINDVTINLGNYANWRKGKFSEKYVIIDRSFLYSCCFPIKRDP